MEGNASQAPAVGSRARLPRKSHWKLPRMLTLPPEWPPHHVGGAAPLPPAGGTLRAAPTPSGPNEASHDFHPAWCRDHRDAGLIRNQAAPWCGRPQSGPRRCSPQITLDGVKPARPEWRPPARAEEQGLRRPSPTPWPTPSRRSTCRSMPCLSRPTAWWASSPPPLLQQWKGTGHLLACGRRPAAARRSA